MVRAMKSQPKAVWLIFTSAERQYVVVSDWTRAEIAALVRRARKLGRDYKKSSPNPSPYKLIVERLR